jgi:hypothetical protein
MHLHFLLKLLITTALAVCVLAKLRLGSRRYPRSHCKALSLKCDEGRCQRCCREVRRYCRSSKDVVQLEEESDENPTLPDVEQSLTENIRAINEQVAGQKALDELTGMVYVAEGINFTLHSEEDLLEVIRIKSEILGIDEESSDELDNVTPFFGADVLLSPKQAKYVLKKFRKPGSLPSRHKRHYALPQKAIQQWPSTVYYTLDDGLAKSLNARRVVRSAAQYWNDNTCLNLVEGLPPSCAEPSPKSTGGSRAKRQAACGGNFVVVVGNGGCASNVGMIGGAQALHLGAGCQNFGTATRQFVHTLGVPSVSQCRGYQAFQQPVRVPMVGEVRTVPSFCNVRSVNGLYCQKSCQGRRNHCLNGGYLHPRNCQTCICPPEFMGPRCEHRCPNPPCIASCPNIQCPPCTQKPCPACIRQPCIDKPPPPPPAHCSTTQWSPWSACSVSCGQGSQSRARQLLTRTTDCSQNVGLTERRVCFHLPCQGPPGPAQITRCGYSQWSAWSQCPHTCGTGCTMTRNRYVTMEPLGSDIPCADQGEGLTQQQTVNLPACPVVHCVPTAWSSWTQCPTTCGEQCVQRRYREIAREAGNGGADCEPLDESRTRQLPRCREPIDCVMNEWTDWSGCSRTCGRPCRVRRSRAISVQGTHGGTPCSAYSRHEVKNHRLRPCPVDCKMSHWAQWSQCTKTCGLCTRRRFRHPVVMGQYGGQNCDESTVDTERKQEEEIELRACPIPCKLSDWTEWSECTATCGMCVQRQSRRIEEYEQHRGTPCSNHRLERSRTIMQASCAQDCVLTEWTDWTECSETCGYCNQYRQRQVAKYEQHGGRPCCEDCRQERKSTFLGYCPQPEGSTYDSSRGEVPIGGGPSSGQPGSFPLPQSSYGSRDGGYQVGPDGAVVSGSGVAGPGYVIGASGDSGTEYTVGQREPGYVVSSRTASGAGYAVDGGSGGVDARYVGGSSVASAPGYVVGKGVGSDRVYIGGTGVVSGPGYIVGPGGAPAGSAYVVNPGRSAGAVGSGYVVNPGYSADGTGAGYVIGGQSGAIGLGQRNMVGSQGIPGISGGSQQLGTGLTGWYSGSGGPCTQCLGGCPAGTTLYNSMQSCERGRRRKRA